MFSSEKKIILFGNLGASLWTVTFRVLCSRRWEWQLRKGEVPGFQTSKLDQVGSLFWPRYGHLNFSERVLRDLNVRVGLWSFGGQSCLFDIQQMLSMLVHFIWNFFAQCGLCHGAAFGRDIGHKLCANPRGLCVGQRRVRCG